MDALDRIHALIEELADVVMKAFPDYTQASFCTTSEGHRHFDVTQFAPDVEGVEIGRTPRRELFDQYKTADGWSCDRSKDQNAYYAKKGILLEGKSDESMAD